MYIRSLIYTLLTTLAFVSNGGYALADIARVPLSFYVVSEEKIPGGHFVDTADFPRLGYIAATPDLVITTLETVAPKQDAVLVQMRADDAKAFTALTERATGKRFLLMLGDTPLIAPRVMAPIRTRSILITLGNATDKKKIEDDLIKLVDSGNQ